MQWRTTPQCGQTKPFGQRWATTAAWHFSSVPYRSMNCVIDKPFCNWTLLIPIAHLLCSRCVHFPTRQAHQMSRLNIVANQEES